MHSRLVSAAVLAATLLLPAVAAASPGSGPTAAVALGDSYISGEAGRWQGNSVDPTPGNSGTDRGMGVYGSSGACHRSDVAEILSSSLPVAERVNLACSGAVTQNVFRASSGGEGQNGEAPQADQLLPVARADDVKLVVLSIGGNDLGFASIVAACLQAYETKGPSCRSTQQPKLDAARERVVAAVEKAIDEVRTVMGQAGYGPSDYRFVVQTYPSVVPRAAEVRYAESDPRRSANGCPFYDEDFDWARDSASRQIGSTVAEAAQARGVEILDLEDAFQGHEFCATATRQATALDTPSAADSEWGRFVGASTVQQGQLQEAFHPNAYGQRAFGACLTQLAAQAPGTFRCVGAAGETPDALVLTRTGGLPGAAAPVPGPGPAPAPAPALGPAPVPAAPVPAAPTVTAPAVTAVKPRLRLTARPRYTRTRLCVRFTVRAGTARVASANVRLASRLRRTDARGRATICLRRHPRRRYTATAHKRGLRSARLVVSVR